MKLLIPHSQPKPTTSPREGRWLNAFALLSKDGDALRISNTDTSDLLLAFLRVKPEEATEFRARTLHEMRWALRTARDWRVEQEAARRQHALNDLRESRLDTARMLCAELSQMRHEFLLRIGELRFANGTDAFDATEI